MENSNNASVLDLLRSKEIGSLTDSERQLVESSLGDESSAEDWHKLVQDLHYNLKPQSGANAEHQNEIARIKSDYPNSDHNEIKSILDYKVKLYKVLVAAAVVSTIMFLFITQNEKSDQKSVGISVKDHPFLTENFVQSTD